MSVRILSGHVLDKLAEIAPNSVQVCVTSPPYYGLRSYGTEPQVWGGDAACAHEWQDLGVFRKGGSGQNRGLTNPVDSGYRESRDDLSQTIRHGDTCQRCTAWRGELGQEPTLALYLEHLLMVFDAVRRVLRDDGTCWVNLGDSYANNRGNGASNMGPKQATNPGSLLGRLRVPEGFKEKDLMLVPARFAIRMQEPRVVAPVIPREVDRAWMAALIDGEGCIGIRQHNDKGEDSSGNPFQPDFIAFLAVAMNDSAVLDRCVEITRMGSVRPKVGNRPDHWKETFGWRLDGPRAVHILRDAYPFLIGKRKQAILVHNLDLSNKHGREMRGNGVIPNDEQAKRALLKELIHRCNQREHVDIPSWCEEPKPEIIPGWWVRNDLVWAKTACMPESVTDRATRSHEYVWHFAKNARYYYDAEAVKEGSTGHAPGTMGNHNGHKLPPETGNGRNGSSLHTLPERRNQRTVWTIGPEPLKDEHYASWPTEIPRRCILAGSSEKGQCPACGAPWVRVVERVASRPGVTGGSSWGGHDDMSVNDGTKARMVRGGGFGGGSSDTTGWSPSCNCIDAGDPIPQTILDPFIGSGRTGIVADRLGRDCIGIELSPANVAMSERLIRGDSPMFAMVEVLG